MAKAGAHDRLRPRRGLSVAAAASAALVALLLWRLPPVLRVEVTEYAMLEPRDTPTAIAVAPDGTVWFTIDFANAIGRIRNGTLERLPEPQTNLEPIGLAISADGAAWYTDAAARQIQRVAPSGEVTSFTLDTAITKLGKIAAATDGALWFAELSAYSVTRFKGGKLRRYLIDSVRAEPYGVAVADDGTVWVTLRAGNQLLRVTPDGEMKTFDIPTRGSSPSDVAIDSQGSVWFGMLRKASLGRLRNGVIDEFRLPRESARPYSVAADAQGNIWYADLTGFVGKLPAEVARR